MADSETTVSQPGVAQTTDLRRRTGGSQSDVDRRRRNGESAKRSRAKRKELHDHMEESYANLVSTHKQLITENMKLRELVLSLGGDASAIPKTKQLGPEVLACSRSKKAKHVKSEHRVDLAANSFEPADTHPSQQLEKHQQPLAAATTVLF